MDKLKILRCLFVCNSATKRQSYNSEDYEYDVTFQVSKSDANKDLFKQTPLGSLSISAVKGLHFEVGKEYSIDITLAE